MGQYNNNQETTSTFKAWQQVKGGEMKGCEYNRQLHQDILQWHF